MFAFQILFFPYLFPHNGCYYNVRQGRTTEKIFQIVSETVDDDPNHSCCVINFPVQNKLTSTHHCIDFTSQHSHKKPAKITLCQLNSSYQIKSSRRTSTLTPFIIIFFFFTKCIGCLEPTGHTRALHRQIMPLFHCRACSFAVFLCNMSIYPLLISCKYYTFPNQW